MRILLVHRYLNRIGGTSRVVWHLAHELSRAHEVHVLTSHVGEAVPGAIIHRVPGPRRPTALSLVWTVVCYSLWILRQRPRYRFDIIHSTNDESLIQDVITALGVHRAGMRRRRVGGAASSWRARLREIAKRIIRVSPMDVVVLAMERLNLAGRRYDGLIAISPGTRRELAEEYGVPLDEVVVVPLGVNLAEFAPACEADRKEARSEYGTSGKLAIVTAATEFRRKGVPELIRAVAELTPAYPSISLLVAGRDDPREMVAFARSLGVEQQVRFVGRTPDLRRFFAAGDVFALPTRYEGFGLTILEAMAMGLPVVVTATGVGELLHDGKDAIVLRDPGSVSELVSRLRFLLHDDGNRRALGSAARAFAERMTWSASAASALAVYERILAKRRRP